MHGFVALTDEILIGADVSNDERVVTQEAVLGGGQGSKRVELAYQQAH
ncbi:MAG: hypothetical protein NVSMB18_34830 [Acetobacteraceae bacterium]